VLIHSGFQSFTPFKPPSPMSIIGQTIGIRYCNSFPNDSKNGLSDVADIHAMAIIGSLSKNAQAREGNLLARIFHLLIPFLAAFTDSK